MTKVQARYALTRPLNDHLLRSISDAPSLFGLTRVRMTSEDSLLVEYDASRLTPAQVDAALRRAGIPAERRA